MKQALDEAMRSSSPRAAACTESTNCCARRRKAAERSYSSLSRHELGRPQRRTYETSAVTAGDSGDPVAIDRPSAGDPRFVCNDTRRRTNPSKRWESTLPGAKCNDERQSMRRMHVRNCNCSWRRLVRSDGRRVRLASPGGAPRPPRPAAGTRRWSRPGPSPWARRQLRHGKRPRRTAHSCAGRPSERRVTDWRANQDRHRTRFLNKAHGPGRRSMPPGHGPVRDLNGTGWRSTGSPSAPRRKEGSCSRSSAARRPTCEAAPAKALGSHSTKTSFGRD